jgi:allophanate hydrolase subunit 2
MDNNFFEIKRAGINTTFQDKGRENLYHIGIPFSGVMDNRNFLLANKLVGNKENLPVLEFAYQGPLIKFNGNKITIAITGDVIFKLKKENKEIEGKCYESYQLENGDEIDILSTNKSVYGYLAISGEFDLKFQWRSCSVNTKANIGSNDGKKLANGQKINISTINFNQNNNKINYLNSKVENIRVIKGTNFDYFSKEGKKIFLKNHL